MRQITHQIGSQLAERVHGFKYNRPDMKLYRATEVGWQAIAVEVLSTSSKEVGKLAAYAQVRVDQIEAVYTPHHPHLNPEQAKSHPTLTVNCDGLLRDKSLMHGFQLGRDSIDTFTAAYASALLADIVPWLNKYSDEQVLFDDLSQPDHRHWVTSDRLTRFPVMMAILARRRDLEAFDAAATEFRAWCKQPFAMVHAPFAEAMMAMRPCP